MRPHLFAALAAALAVCACSSAPPPVPTPIGRLYTYVRSNQDGTLPERIYQFRAGHTRLEVGKIVERCANAAFVTADLDIEHGHGLAFTGGRIARDATQAPFAWLSYDASASELHARVPSANIDQRAQIAGTPFIIYDFDLSDLNATLAGRPARRGDFRFAVALLWPAPGATDVFRNLGWAEARYAGVETHLEREALRFAVSGALNGELWLDAREGHVLEARFAEPNHSEYADFRMVLQGVENDAAARWLEVRQAHWRDCP